MLVAVSVIAGTTVLGVPRPAVAAPARTAEVRLPNGFGAIEVDPATQRVFVSSTASSVVTAVADNGAVLGSITVPGAGALLVDGPTLYVASTTAGRIDAFNTATLAPTASYGAGWLVKPSSLVKAGGLLWTTTGNCGSFSAQLVSIDTTAPSVLAHPAVSELSYCPQLFTSPTDPTLILGFEEGISPTTVVRLDVSTGAPVVEGSLRTDNSNAADAEVMPDGQTLALASGWPYEIRTFGVDPLRPYGVVYPTRPYPTAVEATAANGGLLAAGGNGIYDNDVDVFRLGDPSGQILTYDLGGTDNTVHRRGLAFSGDGTRLFVVSGSWEGVSRLTVFELSDQRGRFTPLTPARILDTRTGTGGISRAVGPGETVDVQVTGRGGVPATGVAAVALNVTVTQPSATGYLTVFPSGGAPPLASNLNFTPGRSVPNLVVTKVGQAGKVSVFNSTGSTHVIFDVAGWYSSSVSGNAGRFFPVVPARVLDTRTGTGGGVRLGAGQSLDLQVTGRGGVPSNGAAAVAMNVAVTGTTAPSFLAVHPTGEARPLASNVNFAAGDTVSNRVMVKLGAGGRVSIYNHAGSADVVVDVGGWYTDASVAGTSGIFTTLPPARLLDTRNVTGGIAGPIGAGSGVDVQITGRWGVPASGVSAVVLNATVVDPAARGWLTISPTGTPRPLASDLNFAAGETRPNLVVVKVGDGGKVSLYTSATAHVVFDVAGWIS